MRTQAESSGVFSLGRNPPAESADEYIAVGLPTGTYTFGITLNDEDAEPTGTFAITLTGLSVPPFSLPAFIEQVTVFGFTATSPISEVDIAEYGGEGLGPFTIESPSYVITPRAFCLCCDIHRNLDCGKILTALRYLLQ